METYKERMERKEKRKDCADRMLKEKGDMMSAGDKHFVSIFANPGFKKDAIPSESSGISKDKAKKMLKEGTAHGKPLSDKQKGMLGATAGKGE